MCTETPNWIINAVFFILGVVSGVILTDFSFSTLIFQYNGKLAQTLLPVFSSTVSITFLVLTFLLAEYSSESLNLNQRPLVIGIAIMFTALVSATASVAFGVLSLWTTSGLHFTLSLLLFIIEIVIIIGGTNWLIGAIVGISDVIDSIAYYVK